MFWWCPSSSGVIKTVLAFDRWTFHKEIGKISAIVIKTLKFYIILCYILWITYIRSMPWKAYIKYILKAASWFWFFTKSSYFISQERICFFSLTIMYALKRIDDKSHSINTNMICCIQMGEKLMVICFFLPSWCVNDLVFKEVVLYYGAWLMDSMYFSYVSFQL